jgi:hypothetical protein
MYMNKFRQGLLGAFVLWLSANSAVFAIEGLQVSVQNTNVVLSWPSDPSETYVIQYRSSLTSTDGWQTLTASWPADVSSNLTFFVHTNGVNYGYSTTNSGSGGGGGSSGGGGLIPPGSGGGSGGGSGMTFIPGVGFYQAARLGVHIVGLSNLTNDAVSNSIVMPFEAANDVGSLHSVVVLVDGTRYRGADPIVTPNISGQITMDTSFLENGQHTVQVVASWLNSDPTDPNNHFFSRTSDDFTLSVSNVIYYPDWDDEIGELGFAYYSFETTCTNSTWQIDIYDISNNLARTLTGNTGDGLVETNWDLIDTNSVLRTTNDADSEFTAVITVGDPLTKKTPTKRKPYAYPSQGQWMIVYQDKFGSCVRSNEYWNSINDFGSIGAANGGAVSVFPTPGHPEYGQTFPMRYPYTNNPSPPTSAQIIADENAFFGMLTNNLNRNFYFNGHGNGESFATINADAVSAFLSKRHYYRFVFLDACSTANGSLPAAFGINMNAPQSLGYFQTHGLRPRTFLGYNKDVIYAEVGDFIDSSTGMHYPYRIPERNLDFLNNFEFYWYFNYDIGTSIYNAQNDTPDLRYGWEDGADLNLYGYIGLFINGYNYQTDWPN